MNDQRRPLAALFDWDGTLVPGFTLLPWVEHLLRHGLFSQAYKRDLDELFRQYESHLLAHEILCSQSASIYAKGLVNLSVERIAFEARAFADQNSGGLHSVARSIFPV